MKILFVYPNSTRQEYIPLGIAYLSAALKSYGHTTCLHDGTFYSMKALPKSIERHQPDIIAFSIRSPEAEQAKESISLLKKHTDIPVIVGGIHPTVSPEEVLHWEGVEAVCVGEGEFSLVQFCNAYGTENVYATPNFYFIRDGVVIKNPCNLVKDIDALPNPDRELFEIDKYLAARDGRLDVISGRGCPFNCTYCINHVIKEIVTEKNEYVRVRIPINIIDEIRGVIAHHHVKSLEFVNDIFTLSQKWLEDFVAVYRRDINLPFVCNARVELMTPEIANLLKNAGCIEVQMGIESGSERIRSDILGRKMSNNTIRDAFGFVRDAGMKTYAFNMVGLPEEGISDLKASLELNRQIMPDAMQVSIFQPYPGTQLYQIVKDRGWISKKNLPKSHKSFSIMRYPGWSSWEIRFIKLCFRFFCLLPMNPIKAFAALLFDVLEDMYSSLFRSRLSPSLKRYIYRLYARYQSN